MGRGIPAADPHRAVAVRLGPRPPASRRVPLHGSAARGGLARKTNDL